MLLSISDLVISFNIFMFIFNPKFNMNSNKNKEGLESTQRQGQCWRHQIHHSYDSTLCRPGPFVIANQFGAMQSNAVYDVVVHSALHKNLIACPSMQIAQQDVVSQHALPNSMQNLGWECKVRGSNNGKVVFTLLTKHRMGRLLLYRHQCEEVN